MWFNKTGKTAVANSPKWNVKGFKGNLTAYYFKKGLNSQEFGAFMCWCESHTLPFLLALDSKERRKESAHNRKKKGKYMVSGQATALFCLPLRHFQRKTWEELSTFSEAVVGPATGNWCVEISPVVRSQFEKMHLRRAHHFRRRRHRCVAVTFGTVAVN